MPFPVQIHRNPPNIFLLNVPASYGRPKQEQEFLLDVGGQVQEGEDLCHPGGGDLGVAGEFGLVGDLAGAEEFIAVDGEGHEAGDAGDLAFRSIVSGAGAEVLVAVVAADGVELASDGEGDTHTAVSWVRAWKPWGRKVREIWPCWPW